MFFIGPEIAFADLDKGVAALFAFVHLRIRCFGQFLEVDASPLAFHDSKSKGGGDAHLLGRSGKSFLGEAKPPFQGNRSPNGRHDDEFISANTANQTLLRDGGL